MKTEKPKILLIDAELATAIHTLLISAYEDLAEVNPRDGRSKVELKNGMKDVASAMKLMSCVSWKSNQEM